MEEKKKLTITLKIAEKSYRLEIVPDKEESYRLAEREVNGYIAKFKQAQYKEFSTQDYLAMAALHLAISNVVMKQSREVGDDDMQALDHLNNELDHYLNQVK
ncbi:MAG: cell division protein ZapA [Alistipes sp.]